MEWLKSLWTRWKVQVSVVGGVEVSATTETTTTGDTTTDTTTTTTE